jgi:hypothetical protein
VTAWLTVEVRPASDDRVTLMMVPGDWGACQVQKRVSHTELSDSGLATHDSDMSP